MAPAAADGGTTRRRFCSQPFRHLEVVESGDAHLCCSGWLPRSVGNVWKDAIPAIWNGAQAREVRQSILDGSFTYCSACPFLASVTGPVRYVDAVEAPDELAILEAGSTLVPRILRLNLAYDRTCNLSCPSCRTGLVVAGDQEYRTLTMLQRRLFAGDLLSQVDWLYVTGSGDPFASRPYRELLREIEPARHPHLRIKLHTNGLLFSPANWDALGPSRALVEEVEVSIDAASESTYLLNRRGGDWGQLLRRLAFVSELRRSGPVRRLQLSFVVQANNWREMPAFVDLAEAHGADLVLFTPLQSWNTFSREELAQRMVCDARHPEHRAFEASLADSRLRRPTVAIGGGG
jgi:MoaA/NifB/PqqE/SkfB family radical SAM enzyme